MKPICFKCKVEMKPEKNGQLVEFVGTNYDGITGPFQIWSGDRWGCPVCQIQIVTGLGDNPVAQHHNSYYMSVRETDADLITVGGEG